MGDIILSKEIYETVKIKDHTGKVLSEFSFNPSDANIVGRYEEFIKGLDELRKQIQAYEDSEKDGKYDKNAGMLDVINKNITEEDIMKSCKIAFEGGYSSVKLYFMIGLPTETDDDIRGIAE